VAALFGEQPAGVHGPRRQDNAIPRIRASERRKQYSSKNGGVKGVIEEETIATQEDAVSTDVLSTRAADFARMRSYEAANITSPARSIEVDETEVNRG
jgi:hypothetical protein